MIVLVNTSIEKSKQTWSEIAIGHFITPYVALHVYVTNIFKKLYQLTIPYPKTNTEP